mmetsp:Transcript_13019/g.46291  ORF Transcript_13019/g.46291 Transcript_13019/m.46291 type:complete len:280 (-) Transcript_13019:308-1147(-)
MVAAKPPSDAIVLSRGAGIQRSSLQKSMTRSSSVPVIVRVPAAFAPWAQSDKAAVAPFLIELPCEKERARLLSLAAEGNVLKQENRSLNLEVARMRRQARLELSLQRQEMMTQTQQRQELQHLAAEAHRLINLKEKLDVAEAFSNSPMAAAGPPDFCLTERQRQSAEQHLTETHTTVMQRAQIVCGHRGTPTSLSAPSSPWEHQRPTTPGREGPLTDRLAQLEALRQSIPPVGLTLRRPRIAAVAFDSLGSGGFFARAGAFPLKVQALTDEGSLGREVL